MRIDREEIHENKIVCSNTMQITLDDDFNVPDSKADIETIVKERGSVHIDTVKAVGDRAEVTGGMDFAVLYAGSESGEKSVLPVKMTGTMNIGEVVDGELVLFSVQCEFSFGDAVAIASDSSAEEGFRAVDNVVYAVVSEDNVCIFSIFIRYHDSENGASVISYGDFHSLFIFEDK